MIKQVIFYTEYGDIVSGLDVKLYPEQNYVEIHQTVEEGLTHNIIKEMLVDFEALKEFVRAQGITRILTGTLTPKDTMLKFWEMFGFIIVDGKLGYMEV